jgi:hypothetical protein
MPPEPHIAVEAELAAPLVVAAHALPRLVSAMVAEDDLEGELTLHAAIERLSVDDRLVLSRIVARVGVIEQRDGPDAAEAALQGVLAVLTDGRPQA